MDAERWKQIEALYQAALDLPEGGRPAFLEQSCGDDQDLLRQVQAMLESDARAGNFLEAPAFEEAAHMLAAHQSTDRQPDIRESTSERAQAFRGGERIIAHYRILEKLGAGGMGVVYKALDVRLGRLAALKFLPENAARDELTLKRFQREARIASALDHPHICTIYEIGEDEGRFFIAMQYLEGENLKRRIQRKALSGDEFFDFAIQIADALDAAHARGIIHRDIKPANIFLANSPGTRSDVVKVLDFGIAKLTDAEETESAAHPLTHAGMTMGTAAYMSPEQARGEILDFRTDLFSFGALLYEMATGRQAFSASTTALIHDAVLNRDPAPPSSLKSRLPAGFDAVISKALEKDRELRCQSAAELRADLKRLKRDAGSGSSAVTAAGTSGTPSRGIPLAAPVAKRRRLPWAVAVLAALVPLVAAAAWYARSSGTSMPRFTERALTPSFGAPAFDAAISPDGNLLAYADNAGLHLKVVDTGEVYQLPLPAGLQVYQIGWYPNNRNLLLSVMPVTSLHTQLWTESVFGGPPRLIRDDVRDASVSPDGSLIAFTTNTQDALWVMNTSGEQPKRMASTTPAYSLADPAWYPGTRTIVYLLIARTPNEIVSKSMARSNGGTLFRSFDLDTGKPARFSTDAGGEFSILGDGRLLYLRGVSGGVGLYEIAGLNGGHPRLLRQWDGISAYRLTASSDGRRLAQLRYVSELGVFVARLAEGGKRVEEVRKLKLSGSENSFHAWTPDGRAVLFTSNRDGAPRIFDQALDRPDEEHVLANEPGAVTGRFTPDGKWLLYRVNAQNGEVRVMRIPAAGGIPQAIVNDRRLQNYFCSGMPADFCAVSFTEQNQLVFRRLDPKAEPPAGGFSGQQLPELARSDFAPTDWGVSPDGTKLAMVRPDPDEARIHIVSLDGKPVSDVIVKGWNGFQTLNWARGGNGWYVSARRISNGMPRVPAPFAYVDPAGNATLLNAPDSFMPSWGIPSPDGRYFAFAASPGSVNVWLLERF